MLETFDKNSKYTIKLILKDDNNWERFYAKHKDNIREVVVETVNKAMACGDKDKLGYSLYMCHSCGHKHYVANTCKTRFCNSCGKIMTDKWMEWAEKNLLNAPYHHIIFSPPEELWLLCAVHRECLDLLFKAVRDVILSWCTEQGFLPGFISVMHTFGATLDFHPHIHVLWPEGGLGIGDNREIWQPCRYFPEKVLKERFKYYLVKHLRAWAKNKSKKGLLAIPRCIKQMWQKKLKCSSLYETTVALYKIIWYVYIGEKLDNAVYTARYIGRYTKRPCISETKIVDYNRKKRTVSFIYFDKKTKTKKITTISVDEFIGRLVRHIPEKHFKMIRHYGFYANRVKNQLMPILLSQAAMLFTMAHLKFEPGNGAKTWRERIMQYTGKDPLICPYCNEQMELTEIAYRVRDGPLKIIPIFS